MQRSSSISSMDPPPPIEGGGVPPGDEGDELQDATGLGGWAPQELEDLEEPEEPPAFLPPYQPPEPGTYGPDELYSLVRAQTFEDAESFLASLPPGEARDQCFHRDPVSHETPLLCCLSFPHGPYELVATMLAVAGGDHRGGAGDERGCGLLEAQEVTAAEAAANPPAFAPYTPLHLAAQNSDCEDLLKLLIRARPEALRSQHVNAAGSMSPWEVYRQRVDSGLDEMTDRILRVGEVLKLSTEAFEAGEEEELASIVKDKRRIMDLIYFETFKEAAEELKALPDDEALVQLFHLNENEGDQTALHSLAGCDFPLLELAELIVERARRHPTDNLLAKVDTEG
ncbi:hypothetical protein TeGR_g1441 [Tetraparma gracilis]|uniref:Uncharacterized protein n=1 Tax=Tetraparma gracilis TaxID=2962635 RepID=A0ABQ6MVT4_9STRA|nr:hypothetical protein TeGR_g1441 [Tetraparma gracilis]